jgi:protein disulfide-isomerase A6
MDVLLIDFLCFRESAERPGHQSKLYKKSPHFGRMPIALFFAAALAGVIEVTVDNVETIIGGSRPAFLKFYLPNCPACQAAEPEFSAASDLISPVLFGAINCESDADLCGQFNITRYPLFILFPTGETTGIQFIGTGEWNAFCAFLTENTEFKCREPPEIVFDVNPRRLDKLTEEKKCLLLTFYTTWSKPSLRWLFEVNHVARAFQAESDIAFGSTDCEKYGQLCKVYDIPSDSFPVIMLFKGDDVIDYSEEHSRRALLDFVNRNCGSDRGLDGYLNSRAGLIPEAEGLLKEFSSAADKPGMIEKMKQIKGASVYVKVMERSLAHGTEQILKDLDSMQGILSEKNNSWQVLDGVKRRYNVFAQFIENIRDQL